MKIVEVVELPDCDICKLDFPLSQPSPAKYEGPINGPWGFMCFAHRRIVKGLTIKLVVKK